MGQHITFPLYTQTYTHFLSHDAKFRQQIFGMCLVLLALLSLQFMVSVMVVLKVTVVVVELGVVEEVTILRVVVVTLAVEPVYLL